MSTLLRKVHCILLQTTNCIGVVTCMLPTPCIHIGDSIYIGYRYISYLDSVRLCKWILTH